MSAGARLRQGLRALAAWTTAVDYDLAAQYLTPPLMDLFRKMRRSEQLHSLNVLRDVLTQGSTPRELAAAALLHDVGKSRYPIGTLQKTLAVIIRAISPSLFERRSKGNPANMWYRPFVVYTEHPAWGAELVAQAGASDNIVWLVAHHQEPAEQWNSHPLVDWLRCLQQADDSN